MSFERKIPRIILVDDHRAVLQQTVRLLSGTFEIVAALETGDELLEIVRSKGPVDLVVLDITLPQVTGIEWASRLRKAGCTAKTAILTVHADPDYVREALDAGALAYVIKPRLATDLIPALYAALAGKRFISPTAELEEVI